MARKQPARASATGKTSDAPAKATKARSARRAGTVGANTGHTPPPVGYSGNIGHDPQKGAEGNDPLSIGRTAAEATERPIRWLWSPWIGRDFLTFLVGQPNTGKSTFLAWLCARAGRVVMLPGFEEPFDQMTLPRLKAHGADLGSITVLDGRPWHLRANLNVLCDVVRARRANLVLIDPIDSYIGEDVHENDAQGIRPILEAGHLLAERTGAAVVATRHPAKDPANVCPGGRSWRAVPRIIVELVEEPSQPPRRFVKAYKYGVGRMPAPLSFTLDESRPGPPLFLPGETVASEVAQLAKDVPDRMERSKIETACGLLRALLAEDDLEAKEVFSWGEKERLSETTIRRAAALVGVHYHRGGFGLDCRCLWSLRPFDAKGNHPGGGSVRQPLATTGRKPEKQGSRPVVAKRTGRLPPPATSVGPAPSAN